MRNVQRIVALGLGLAGLAGCGSSDASAADADAGATSAPGIDFAVGKLIDQNTNDPIVGAQLCVWGTSSCATTDAQGHAVVPGAPVFIPILMQAVSNGLRR